MNHVRLLILSINILLIKTLLFASIFSLNAQQVYPDGRTGSYNLTIPPDDYVAGNTFDEIGGGAAGAAFITKGPNYTGPFQSHQWWTSALWNTVLGDGTHGEVAHRGDNHSEMMYPYPLVLQATQAGFVIQNNPHANNVSAVNQVNNGPALTHMRVGFIGQNSNSTSVDGYGDYHATFLQTYGGNELRATTASGCPYLFLTRTGNTDLNFYNQGTSTLNAVYTDANVHAISLSTNPGPTTGIIGIFFPPGTTINGETIASYAGSVGNMPTFGANFNADIPDASRYITVAVLPDASQATLTLFAQKAFNFITQTTHTYAYNEATATLTTSFNTTTNNVYGAANTGTLQALYRHQWLYSPQATGATYTGLQYATPRGMMRLINSSSFQTVMKNLGILPNLGWANTGNTATLNTFITNYAASLGNMPTAADGYNKDHFSELTTNLQIAKQIGNTAAFNTILNQLRSRLQDWLVANDADYNRYFAYSPLFNHMAHYPNGFGSSGTFVDGHFHVGYIVNAAAILARYDASFVTNYGPMVETVIRSIANDTKEMTDPGSNGTVRPWFPYLKYFDPYAGHSWADAKATNQESVSEALHFATGVLLWGEASSVVTGSTAMRDLGALLYITEAEAARQYWFDVDGAVNGAPYANAYTHRHMTMVYNWGGNYATFFGTEPEYIHGITYLPVTGASTWLGVSPDDAATEFGQIGQNYAGWDNWGQDINALHGTFNPDAAIAAFNTYRGAWPSDKYAFTYHWNHTFDSVGVIDPTVQADITSFQVFEKGPCKHYMIYMPPGKGPKLVTFTDGESFNVPDDTVITYVVCPSLPLDLLSFTAKQNGAHAVDIDWSTASEVNIDRFELEVSTDGKQWHKIHEQASTGITNGAGRYHYTDYSPSKGINYYRLHILEHDGTFSYSKIQVVRLGSNTSHVMLYPNPTENIVHVELNSTSDDIAHISLIDVMGRVVLNGITKELNTGLNAFTIDASDLNSATYILHLSTVSGSIMGDYKIVKK